MTIGKSREDYLEAIFVLKKRAGFVRSVDVAHHLKITQASVCKMMRVLEEENYIVKLPAPPYLLSLTEKGRLVAEQVYERHCFFCELLVGAGVDEETAEREACELEHAISPKSFRLLSDAVRSRR